RNDPLYAWLIFRGIKILPIRMDRHCDNAEKIVNKLMEHEKVKNVYYPGIGNQAIAEKQMARPGGVIAFDVDGDKQAAQKFLNTLSCIKVAVSVGDLETLLEHPATMTHAVIAQDARKDMRI